MINKLDICSNWWVWQWFWECDWSNGQTMIIELLIGLSIAGLIFAKQHQIYKNQEFIQRQRESIVDKKLEPFIRDLFQIIRLNQNVLDTRIKDLPESVKNNFQKNLKSIAKIIESSESSVIHPTKLKRLIGLLHSWLNNTNQDSDLIDYGVKITNMKNMLYFLTAYGNDYQIKYDDIIEDPRPDWQETLRKILSQLVFTIDLGMPKLGGIKAEYHFGDLFDKK